MIKKTYNWIKEKLKWLLIGTGAISVAFAGTSVNLIPEVLNYPLLANTSIEKLEWIYSAQEVLRLEHNVKGQQYRENVITEAQWKEYLNTSFKGKSKWLGYEKSLIRESLEYSIIKDFDKTSEGKTEKSRQYNEAKLFKKSTRWNIKTDKIFNKNIVSAATEDFTTYTETDPNSKLGVTASKIDIQAIDRADAAYVIKDKGADYFNGDFTYLIEGYVNSATSDGYHVAGFVLANITNKNTTDLTDDALMMKLQEETGEARFGPVEHDSGTGYQDFAIVSKDTLYYLEIERDESVGTYGTLYVRAYSDSGRTSLVDTGTQVLHSSKKDFRYLYGFTNREEGSGNTFTGYVQNLDLQEAVAVTGFQWATIIQ